MKNIKISATGSYLPKIEIDNNKLAKKLNITQDFIHKRTGIDIRYYSENETIETLAIKSIQNLLKENSKIDINDIDMIIVATTSSNLLMPGISYKIQEHFKIENCMCLDILAGCAGFINALDIARNYIALEKVKKALVVGTDILSKYLNESDIDTSILLSDGAGAIILEETNQEKKYVSNIKSEGQKGNILEIKSDTNIKMIGKEVYKYAVTETIKNINELLKDNKTKIDEIKYIIPHQSNLKIMNSITNRLKIDNKSVYINIQRVGNTFCASIPIALDDMFKRNLLQEGDKIILLGYGGGLNTGSILMEV